jgi:serine/threonine-protein kinase PpkA
VEPANVSSQGFNEDAYAGIKQAIDEVDWSGYDARYVILITDAGPRVSGDSLGATGLDTPSLHRLARDNDIALWVMHLRTPEGAGNHAYAEGHYRRLSQIDNIGDFYYPVETGDVNSFEQALAAMTDQLVSQVAAIRSVPRPESATLARPDQPEQLTEFQDKVAKLGYALRMRYLQSGTGSVPQLFNAWMVDRVFEDPGEQSMDVRVLLTRDQLSDLHEVLRQVLLTAEEGTLAPQNFLDELKSLAATFSRDPEAVSFTTGGSSLAELGYLREYIEDLPYQSMVMDLDLSTWQQWSAQQQFEFVNTLEGKIAYYQSLHSNVDLWVSLGGGPVDGDSVYPLLLEALP